METVTLGGTGIERIRDSDTEWHREIDGWRK